MHTSVIYITFTKKLYNNNSKKNFFLCTLKDFIKKEANNLKRRRREAIDEDRVCSCEEGKKSNKIN
jgi:hypothetical protein